MKPVRGVIEEADIKLGSLMYNQGKEHTTLPLTLTKNKTP